MNGSVLFSGKERDAETGNEFFGARYFSGAQGRWTTPDWSTTPQPVPYADLTDPQTLNLYTYVRNNPLLRADKDGHCDWCSALYVKLTAWLAVHPQIGDAASEVRERASGTGRVGLGAALPLKAVRAEGSATLYGKAGGEGGGTGVDLKGSVGVGSVGAEMAINIPVVKDGSLVNPVTAASVVFSGNASVSGERGALTGSANGSETSIGGTIGEGIVAGAEVASSNNSLSNLFQAIGNAIIGDIKNVLDAAKQTIDAAQHPGQLGSGR